jgi:hypothetical protein
MDAAAVLEVVDGTFATSWLLSGSLEISFINWRTLHGFCRRLRQDRFVAFYFSVLGNNLTDTPQDYKVLCLSV